MARRLGPNRRLLAASAEYLARRGLPRHPRDLAAHACLVLDVGDHPQRWTLVRRGSTESVEVQGLLRSNHGPALHDACRRGVAVALLPAFVLTADFASGQLQPVLPAWATREPGIYAIYPGFRFIPAKVGALVDYVAERLRSVPS